MNSKVIDFGTVLLAGNHAIFVVLTIILVSTAVASSQMADAKNTTASTSPFTSMQRLPLAASSTTNQTNTSGLSSMSPSTPTTRIFNIYSTHATGFNETKGVQKANLTSDQYSLQTILVNQGDKIVVNLYNMEAPSGDRHSFTIDAPYNVNIDTSQGGNGIAAFVADHVGTFKFYCKYHNSMVGELVILPRM